MRQRKSVTLGWLTRWGDQCHLAHHKSQLGGRQLSTKIFSTFPVLQKIELTNVFFKSALSTPISFQSFISALKCNPNWQ